MIFGSRLFIVAGSLSLRRRIGSAFARASSSFLPSVIIDATRAAVHLKTYIFCSFLFVHRINRAFAMRAKQNRSGRDRYC